MHRPFIFTSLPALVLPGNSSIQHLSCPCGGRSLLMLSVCDAVCFMWQGLEGQTGSHPRTQRYLQQKGGL